MELAFDTDAPLPHPANVDWSPTRAAGLARLSKFLPRAGRSYAQTRNIDYGPEDRSNISALSPWIRRRLITEEEVIAAVLQQHRFNDAEKFIQEVCWRSYWKGWLELRPAVLLRFDHDRQVLGERWQGHSALEAAHRGETGIACFDAWVQELISTGWLHNHSRMWFASIWIFTLRLPWQLGAEFFYRHLIDADPASNTLSWRWVAGLHTRGKHYVARASNISANTLGRFDPADMLNEDALPLLEDAPLPEPGLLVPAQQPETNRVALLLTEEDLSPETLGLKVDVTAIAALPTASVASQDSPARRFSEGAIDDVLARSALFFGVDAEILKPGALVRWARQSRVEEIITPYAPVGAIAEQLRVIEADLAQEGIRLVRIRRGWDSRAWPKATAGFFRFKEHIPKLIGAHL
jgi:deoxyribodipyrimidine photo-lyase